jgi:hypothetical protein
MRGARQPASTVLAGERSGLHVRSVLDDALGHECRHRVDVLAGQPLPLAELVAGAGADDRLPSTGASHAVNLGGVVELREQHFAAAVAQMLDIHAVAIEIALALNERQRAEAGLRDVRRGNERPSAFAVSLRGG